MIPLRTVLFIDGRNFNYNLRAFRFKTPDESRGGELHCYSLDEKHFLWEKFFDGIIKKYNDKLGLEHRLIRAYWYHAEKLRPFESWPKLVEQVVEQYKEEFPDLTADKVQQLAKAWYDRENAHFQNARDKLYENIQRNVPFLEFKYIGEYIFHPFTVKSLIKDESGNYIYEGTRIGEKGVDVGIATDMIAKMSHYDVAVLISGDADFIPAVCYLKENLKSVYQFSLEQGIPPEIKYLSPWLIGVVDIFLTFSELELLDGYLDKDSRIIPPIVKRAINDRIKLLKEKSGYLI